MNVKKKLILSKPQCHIWKHVSVTQHDHSLSKDMLSRHHSVAPLELILLNMSRTVLHLSALSSICALLFIFFLLQEQIIELSRALYLRVDRILKRTFLEHATTKQAQKPKESSQEKLCSPLD